MNPNRFPQNIGFTPKSTVGVLSRWCAQCNQHIDLHACTTEPWGYKRCPAQLSPRSNVRALELQEQEVRSEMSSPQAQTPPTRHHAPPSESPSDDYPPVESPRGRRVGSQPHISMQGGVIENELVSHGSGRKVLGKSPSRFKGSGCNW
eukprot:PhM_4_TR15536/c0_g1_i1/m.40834